MTARDGVVGTHRGSLTAGSGLALLAMLALAGTSLAAPTPTGRNAQRPIGPRSAESEEAPLPPGGLFEDVRAELLGASDGSAETTAAGIAGRGPAAAQAALECLSQLKTDASLRAAAGVLTRLAYPAMEDDLCRIANEHDSRTARTNALRMIGLCARPESATTILRSMEGNRFAEKRIAEEALTEFLRRGDSRGLYQKVEGELNGLCAETRARIISCIGDAGSEHGLRVLRNLLPSAGDLQVVAASAISRMPPELQSTEVLEELAPLLFQQSDILRSAALFALRHARVPELVEKLVAALDDDTPSVRTAAHWSLRQATGVGLPADAERWRAWLDEERAWWENEGATYLGMLDSCDPREVCLAVYALTMRRHLHDGEINDRIAGLIGDERPDVHAAAVSVCAARGLAADGDGPVAARQPAPAEARSPATLAATTSKAAIGAGSKTGPRGARGLLLYGVPLLLLGLFCVCSVLSLRARRRARNTLAFSVKLDRSRFRRPATREAAAR